MKNGARPVGYSGTPLAKKLGIADGTTLLQIDAPKDLRPSLEPLPKDVTFAKNVSSKVDIVHVFATDANELPGTLAMLRKKLRPDAAVWVSWPKKASKVATDITEDRIRDIALPMGWVDVKVCAVTEVWSGLRLVVRKELR